MARRAEVVALLQKRDEDLLSRLFKDAGDNWKETYVPERRLVVYARPPDRRLRSLSWPDDRKGRYILERVWPMIVKAICLDWRYYETHQDGKVQDTIQIVSSLADIVAALSLGVPPVVVSVLVVRRGLASICHLDVVFQSYEEYLVHLLRYPSSPLYSEAVEQLSGAELSDTEYRIVLNHAASRETQEESAVRLLSKVLQNSKYLEESIAPLFDLLARCCKKAGPHKSPLVDEMSDILIQRGEDAICEARERLFNCVKDWSGNHRLIGILCNFLSVTRDCQSLPLLKRCWEMRRSELENWGWSPPRDDKWRTAYEDLLAFCEEQRNE